MQAGQAMRRTKSLDPAVASALRSIETERRGLDVLVAALSNGLGDAFAACIARIQAGQGPRHRHRHGQVRACRPQDRGDAGLDRHAGLLRPSGEASHGDLGMITPDDVVMALSWSGETRELGDLIDYASRFGVTLIAVTCSPDSTLGRAADICLAMPRAEEACPHGLAPTTSALMQLALGDALAVALLEAHGFTASQFRVYHPGGKLGAALKFVRDVMHAGEGMPVVPVGSLMSEAMLVMSSKGLGCVGVIDGEGALLGIVTDGDLRRHMSNDLMARSVDVVMTRRPLTIRPDVLVGEALETMEARKVTALFVVDGLAPSAWSICTTSCASAWSDGTPCASSPRTSSASAAAAACSPACPSRSMPAASSPSPAATAPASRACCASWPGWCRRPAAASPSKARIPSAASASIATMPAMPTP